MKTKTGNIVKIELLKKNMSIKDLAINLNIHVTYLYKILNFQRKTSKNKKKICNILNLPYSIWEQ